MSARSATLLSLLLVILTATLIRAQEAQPPEKAQPPQEEVLSAAEVERRIESLKTATDLEEAQRAAALDAYQKALKEINEAAVSVKKTEELEATTKSAPKDLEEIKAKLDHPAEIPKPQAGSETPKAEIEKALEDARSTAASRTESLEALRKTPDQRAARRKELVDLVVEEKERVDGLKGKQNPPAVEGEPRELTAAKRALAGTTYRAALERQRALEAEMARIDACKDLLTAQIQLAELEKEQADTLQKGWREIADARSQADAEAAKLKAEKARDDAERDDPLVQELAKKNAELTTRTSDLTARMKEIAAKRDRAKAALKEIEDNQSEAEKRIRAVGLTDAIGFLLRQHRLRLPAPGDAAGRIEGRKEEIDDVQLERIAIEEEMAALRDLKKLLLDTWDPRLESVPEHRRAGVRVRLSALLQDRRGYLKDFIDESEKYINDLVALDTLDQQVMARSADYARFIDERVLWIRSAEPLWETDFANTRGSFAWLVSPANWGDAAASAWSTFEAYPLTSILIALAFLSFLIGGEWFIHKVLAPKAQAAKGLAFAPTVKTCVAAIIRALHVPVGLWFLGWAIAKDAEPDSFSVAMGRGFEYAAILFAMLAIMQRVLAPQGLGEAHFGWKGPFVTLTRQNLTWLIAIAVPLIFVAGVFTAYNDREWHNSTGRIALILLLLAEVIFVGRILRPGSGVLSNPSGDESPGWLVRLRWVLFVLALGIPLTLAVLAILGYHFTALKLGGRLQLTTGLIFALVILNGLVLRWLTVSKRLLARKRAAELKQAQQDQEIDESERSNLVEETINELNSVDLQTRRLVRTVIAVAGFFGAWMIWSEVTPALQMLDQVSLWSTTVEVTEDIAGVDGTVRPELVTRHVPISLQNLLAAFMMIVVTILAVRNIPGVLEVGLLQRLPIEQASRYAITTLCRYLLAIVGFTVAAAEIGIGWSKVQWLVAAMSVGLGFGLQEIFANFVSGIIVLFEHRVRVGDTVTVGTVSGTVTRIRVLATTIKDWDRKEFIVPNKDLVTGRLLNWTLSDQVSRITIKVGVAYGTDTAKARKILLDLANAHPRTMTDPEPFTTFDGFGDSTLDLILRCYLPDMNNRLSTITELYESVDAAFKKEGIEIAFPQRDLHVRSSVMPKGIATDEA